jgi:hypothetical protein
MERMTLSVTVDRHGGTVSDRQCDDGDGGTVTLVERSWNVSGRSTVTVMTERYDGDGVQASLRERPARTPVTVNADGGLTVPLTATDGRSRTVLLTGPDQLSVLDGLREWLMHRPGVTLASLTFRGNSWNAEVTTTVIENADGTVRASRQERPEWLSDELLAGTASTAMFAYLDHNPDTDEVELTRWARQYFRIRPGYGRKIKLRWRQQRTFLVIRHSQ